MTHRIANVVPVLLSYAQEHGATPDPGGVLKFAESVLCGDRALLLAYDSGLVTSQEVATALLDRFERRTFDLLEESPRRAEEWSEVISKLHVALFGVDHKDG